MKIYWTVFLTILTIWSVLSGQNSIEPSQSNGQIPLQNLLNSDGTIDLEQVESGSINLNGYQMSTNAEGNPVFFEANGETSNCQWEVFGGACGASGTVSSMAVIGTDLYIGGSFTAIGDVKARNIAKWDGNNWSPLGEGVRSGFGDNVATLAVIGTDLYVGGRIAFAGNKRVKSIARWDGTEWFPVGEGFNDDVVTLQVYNNTLYAGGGFTKSGENTINHVARWNGTNWTALGSGIEEVLFSYVGSMTIFDNKLIVAGSFLKAGGISTNNIAAWNGTNWANLGDGITDEITGVADLAVFQNELYVGGIFSSAGGVSANSIAKWNGVTWSSVGSGLTSEFVSSVNALFVFKDNLYAGGTFTHAGNLEVNNIAKWDGSAWSALGTGIKYENSGVRVLMAFGNELYIGGDFSDLDNVTASNIGKWDGQKFSPVGFSSSSLLNGSDREIKAIAVVDGNLYVAGALRGIGKKKIFAIARWDGAEWHSLGNDSLRSDGVGYYTVLTLAANGTDLYVGGRFSHIGEMEVNNIAKWDGSKWSAMGKGTGTDSNSSVEAITIHNDDVYAAGQFYLNNGRFWDNVAVWNGTSWAGLGEPVHGEVRDMAFIGDDLYVGGSITYILNPNDTVQNVLKWDGTNWSTLGKGTNKYITSLAVIGTDLYVGGDFTMAGGKIANKVAKWDGNVWSDIGFETNGLFDLIYDMEVQGTDLYVGGEFYRAGGVIVNDIAKWDGTTWSALGTGVNDRVEDIFVSGTDIYVGGHLRTAGEKISTYFAKWNANGCGGSCPLNEILDGVIADGTYSASNTITSTSTINLGGKVTFNAGKIIHLKAGFYAQKGADFLAKIEGCSSDFNSEDVFYKKEYVSSLESISEINTKQLKIYPNPFSQSAEVIFDIPIATKEADLIITTIHGSLVQIIPVTQKGAVNMQIGRNNFEKGLYLCALVIDGKITNTEKMIIFD